MTSREFVQEYAGIINLLKEHAYLRYSSAGRAEYEEKERSAVSSFIYLVYRRTGIDLPLPDFSLAEIRPTDSPSLEGARGLVKRTASRLKRLALDRGTPRRAEHEAAQAYWLKALDAMECADRRREGA